MGGARVTLIPSLSARVPGAYERLELVHWPAHYVEGSENRLESWFEDTAELL